MLHNAALGFMHDAVCPTLCIGYGSPARRCNLPPTQLTMFWEDRGLWGARQHFEQGRQQKLVGLKHLAPLRLAALAGLFCVVPLLFLHPRKTAAAASRTESGRLGLPVRRSFTEAILLETYTDFAARLRYSLDQSESLPISQAVKLGQAAWTTISTAPIAAAGVVGQPLARAMIATLLAHACYVVVKFNMAQFALTRFRIPEELLPEKVQKERRRQAQMDAENRRKREEEVTKKEHHPTNFKLPLPKVRLLQKSPRKHTHQEKSADPKRGTTTLKIVPTAGTVPPAWLMLVTALAGPAPGVCAAAVAYKMGHILGGASISSLLQGSVLGTFFAGSLCLGGVGTMFAAKWSSLQGRFATIIGAFLSFDVLFAVFMIVSTLPDASKHRRK